MFVYMSEDVFSYEIQALVKAFFPAEPIVLDIKDRETTELYIRIVFTDTKVRIKFIMDGERASQTEKEINRENRRQFKDSVKRALYEVLSKGLSRELPWGTLTGVRPTKLVMELVDEGCSFNDIIYQMEKRYYCSSEKARLGYQVVMKEKELLAEIDYANGYSVYIGIPFCPTTCLYCSFPSFALNQYSSYVEDYLHALFHEIDYAKDCMGNRKLETVYIGGGTPTTLTAKQLECFLEKVRTSFDFTDVREFTVEAGRPDSITKEKLQVLQKYGVSRISINPQSMKQETLDIIGRHHTIAQVEETFYMARELGFDNINMDLIAGLPNENENDVQNTLCEIDKLDPDSLTMHSLVLKRAALLNMQRGRYEEFTFGNVDRMTGLASEYARTHKMKPYYLYRQKNTTGSENSSRENIGYSKEGKEGLYNILIMEEMHTILALGAGSCSKFVFPKGGRIQRIENVKNVRDYVNRTDEMILRKKNFIEGEYDEFI